MSGGTGINETEFSLLRQRVTGIETSIHTLTEKIEVWMLSRQQNPWKLLAIALGVLVPLGWLLNLYITTAISPVAAVANQADAKAESLVRTVSRNSEDVSVVKSQNADSSRDRSDLNKKYDFLAQRVADNEKEMAKSEAERAANEREVETQIDAMNQSLSVQFANQQRANADFQNALHESGAKVPSSSGGPFYFPNISNRNHHSGR